MINDGKGVIVCGYDNRKVSDSLKNIENGQESLLMNIILTRE